MRTFPCVVMVLWAAGISGAAEQSGDLKARWSEEAKLPVVDLSGETARQVVIAEGTPEVYQGHPTTVVTAELIEAVFDLPCRIIDDPVSHTPLVIPLDGEP